MFNFVILVLPAGQRVVIDSEVSLKVLIGHIRILGIGLELAWNGGSCRGISLKRDSCHLHLKRFPALASVAC